ncbi:hypothetical protein ABXT06_01545 [Flavobacterium sp. UW10123]|uniref:alpha-glutamyl/putrescinyl thymine pyrophosphorylase clade 3 protein n=1 Tax=Flavobacterium sp. UW10123 TaxID=3230800 RepID=UPI003391FF60
MRPADLVLYNDVHAKLQTFKQQTRSLPGIGIVQRESCFIRQIIDSVRRVNYVKLIAERTNNPIVADPSNIAFDPLKAAAWYNKQGNINEAFWLVFLATHFSRHHRTKWNLVKDVYSGLTNDVVWNWEAVSGDVNGFKNWLNDNVLALKARGKVGNHRKYQSLGAYNPTGTGAAVSSYIDWIGVDNNHQSLIDRAFLAAGNDPKLLFKHLYISMNAVMSFGRMAKFDYLTMVGKLGLLDIEPDSTYMDGATGPFTGGRLLFGGNPNRRLLDSYFSELDECLQLPFGMQVIEDAVCNWQKSPNIYEYFGG